MKKILHILLLAVFFNLSVLAQNNNQAQTPEQFFRRTIGFLASDSLQGRETSTIGEKLAGDYIENIFRRANLIPAGQRSTYEDHFNYFAGKDYEAGKNQLIINGAALKLKDEYYTFNFSANASASGKCVFVNYGIVDSAYNDYSRLKDISGKIFVMKAGGPTAYSDPHSDKGALADIRYKCELAQKKGALAVIVVNTDSTVYDPQANLSVKAAELSIPVVFVKSDIANGWNLSKPGTATVQVSLNRLEKTGTNICGFMDNHRENTIIIGGHYDHLGWGIPGSLYTGPKAIHNGADDNASGTSMMLELIREISNNKELHYYNYLFIAFSGEELGLYGSKSFCDSLLGDVKRYNCMINFDMVGRLNPENPTLELNGTGTSPQWKTYLDSVHIAGLKIKTSESGVGPSDQTSFYLKGMPVIHYFTGSHSDYHKPSDDADKINYEGMLTVQRHVLALLQQINYGPKMEFTKTKDDDNENAPKFTVTLGVMPDYMFDGKGMRIDGVTDGKAASKAGLLAKDIVIKLGDHEVVDMMSYMKALSAFKKGDKTTITIQRAGQEMTMDLQF